MIDRVIFPHAPPSSRDDNLTHKDPMNQGVDGTELGPNPTFVDKNIVAEVISLIRQESENSVLAASVFIGNSDLVEELISVEKYERLFNHLNKTLGFITNSRSMTAYYPDYKRDSLLALLQSS